MAARRELTIVSWGNQLHRKGVPFKTDKNFNVTAISDVKPRCDLSRKTGLDPEVQDHVTRQPRFAEFRDAIVAWVLENPGAKTISVNCHKGRHRSVATAQLVALELAHTHGIVVNVRHYDLGKHR